MARVIKQGYVPGTGTGQIANHVPLMHQLKRATVEANEMLAQATRKADMIVRTAQGEADSIRKSAFADGYRGGVEQADRHVSELINRLEEDVRALGEERRRLVQSVEADLLKLCIEAVEKVIRHEVKTDQRVVDRAIKACLRRVTDTSGVRVRVNPQELAGVKARREELLAAAQGAREIDIVDDRRISAGGCIVETPSGDLDARVETQIGQIQAELAETFGDEHNESESAHGEVS